MYPRNYFGLFPPFRRHNKVFVAMSFDEKFRSRWENVIARGIGMVGTNDWRLEPHRVDTRTISDSILTEILGGISNDILFLADVTTLQIIDKKPIRNANVMYEVGLAHAVRLAEEVLLFRSDPDELLFDLANVRVNKYDPDGDPNKARKQVAEAIHNALHEVELKRNLAVQAASRSLDFCGWWVLTTAASQGEIKRFPAGSMRDAVINGPYNAAITRLLDMGALETRYTTITTEMVEQSDSYAVDELMKYTATAFGKAILESAADEQFDMSDPRLVEIMEKHFLQPKAEQDG